MDQVGENRPTMAMVNLRAPVAGPLLSDLIQTTQVIDGLTKATTAPPRPHPRQLALSEDIRRILQGLVFPSSLIAVARVLWRARWTGSPCRGLTSTFALSAIRLSF